MRHMQNRHNNHVFFRLILKDLAGNVVYKQDANLEEFAQLLNDKNVLNLSDDTELEYYIIKHPELRIKKHRKDYWHHEFFSGKGITPLFIFVEE